MVPSESTPFLICLDVFREYGTVIDNHYRVERYLPCAILSTQHLALEMMPRELWGQPPSVLRSPLGESWDQQNRAEEETGHAREVYDNQCAVMPTASPSSR